MNTQQKLGYYQQLLKEIKLDFTWRKNGICEYIDFLGLPRTDRTELKKDFKSRRPTLFRNTRFFFTKKYRIFDGQNYWWPLETGYPIRIQFIEHIIKQLEKQLGHERSKS